MKSLFALLLGLCLMGSTAFAAEDRDAEKKQAAVQAAQQWLKSVDDGNYAESWDQAATFFKEKVTREQWQAAMEQKRKPLGKANSRAVKSMSYASALPNAPAGEYVIVIFETSFDALNPAIEMVTPFLDKDGKWHVSGYYFKPAGM